MQDSDEERQLRGSLEPKEGRCGARLRRTNPQKYCTKWPMANGKCHLHGGGSIAPGPGHPSFKHGRTSKALPANLRAMYDEAMADPQLLSLRSQAAISDIRWHQLIKRLHTGESGSLWALLNKSWSAFQDAQRDIRSCQEKMQAINPNDEHADRVARGLQDAINQHKVEAQEAIISVGKLIESGRKDEAAWRELLDLTHEVADLKKSEIDTLCRLRQVMTVEEAMVLCHNVQLAVAEVVTDPKQKAEIGRKLMKLMSGGASGAAAASSPAGIPAIGGDVIEGAAEPAD